MLLEPPEWVFVWHWLRFVREPQVMTALPAQDFVAPKPIPMSEAVYESYRTEWQKAGAPRASTRKVLEAFGVNPLLSVPDRNPLLED